MAKGIDVEASAQIMSIASKYIIASVVLVAVGAIALVYGALIYLVYGTSYINFGNSSILVSSIAMILGLFIGLALIAIGGFLTLWGLYWLRSEGKRMKSKLNKVVEQVYTSLDWYATRFIFVSIIGVVIGVIAIVYAVLALIFATPMLFNLTSPFQNVSIFLGIFIGIGALAASAVLLVWGRFWRSRVENRSIF